MPSKAPEPILTPNGKRPNPPDWPALLAAARALEAPCRCCCRQCGARRDHGERGFCGAGSDARVSKFFITYGEEAFLNPAQMLYFCHCNLRCAYCSNAESCEPDFHGGQPANPAALAAAIDTAYDSGHITALQIVGGEPSCSLSGAMAVLSRLKSPVPKVWNSNFCFTPEVFELLEQVIDFYVADLKFGDGRCAKDLCGLDQYWSTVTGNLRRVDPDRLLVRHLPLGGHGDCCTQRVISVMQHELPGVPISFHQLLPDPAGITHCLSPDEWLALDRLAQQAGLNRRYADFCLQEDNLANQSFVSEIIIRKDGTVLAQDLSAPVRNLLRGLHDTV